MSTSLYFNDIIVAPILSDAKTLILYRDNGEEILAKINTENKTITSEKKLNPDEIDFIKDNYL
jgi:hypothetical protein